MIVYETAAAYVQPLHQRSCKGSETREKGFSFLETSGFTEIAGKRNTMCVSKLAENGNGKIFR